MLFRNQKLTPEQHIAFSRRFGELQPHILKDFNMGSHPELFVVSNIKNDGKPIGRAGAGQYWHSDVSYVSEPSLGSVMYAIEVPPTGGDTMFANMYKAYETLSEPMRRFLEGLEAEHDFAHSQTTQIASKGYTRTASAEEIAKVPPVLHPVIRTHPESKRNALYVNLGFTTRIVVLPPTRAERCWIFYSRIPRNRSSSTGTSGASETSCFGITAPPCIVRSMTTDRMIAVTWCERPSRAIDASSKALDYLVNRNGGISLQVPVTIRLRARVA